MRDHALRAVAEELESARGRLEALAAGLCCDAAVAGRHLGALQGFDELGQHLGELARVLSDSAAAGLEFEHVRLDRLRTRLEGRRDRAADAGAVEGMRAA